jgi:hypothetical protein
MAETGKWNTAPGFFDAMNDWLKRTLNAATVSRTNSGQV